MEGSTKRDRSKDAHLLEGGGGGTRRGREKICNLIFSIRGMGLMYVF